MKLCNCGCGNPAPIIQRNSFTQERIKGQYSKFIFGHVKRKHGEAKDGYRTPEYEAWKGIVQRCTNVKRKNFKDYGGRGVKICDEWLNDYSAFLAYVGRRPSPKHSIDRYPNNNGNYEPGNVRWATPIEQANNTRKIVLITFNEQSKSLGDWSRELKINRKTLAGRLLRGMFPFGKNSS